MFEFFQENFFDFGLKMSIIKFLEVFGVVVLSFMMLVLWEDFQGFFKVVEVL